MLYKTQITEFVDFVLSSGILTRMSGFLRQIKTTALRCWTRRVERFANVRDLWSFAQRTYSRGRHESTETALPTPKTNGLHTITNFHKVHNPVTPTPCLGTPLLLETSIKHSGHFVQLLKSVDTLVSYDIRLVAMYRFRKPSKSSVRQDGVSCRLKPLRNRWRFVRTTCFPGWHSYGVLSITHR
jgi:hypothetical protein